MSTSFSGVFGWVKGLFAAKETAPIAESPQPASVVEAKPVEAQVVVAPAVVVPSPAKPPAVKKKADFGKVVTLLPDLLAEMKADMAKDRNMREFAVVAKKSFASNHSGGFIYYKDVTPDLDTKISILEEQGLVRQVRAGGMPIYRMNDNFVAYLSR